MVKGKEKMEEESQRDGRSDSRNEGKRVKSLRMNTTSSSDPVINVAELGQYIKRKRESERLSLRAVARLTQVSASTLSRIENGTGVPDTPTLARIARWLNVPLERVVTGKSSSEDPVVYYPQESVPDIVEAHLRADPNLTPETARALAELFRVAYNQFSPKSMLEDDRESVKV
jgi:transcriptional regulator with XRE-family HTH domain